jgi:hypothetical protein
VPLDRPRRIFVRKRRFQTGLALRSAGFLALGLSAAAGATALVQAWPAGAPVLQIDLPAVTEAPVLRVHDPVMRVAATLPRRWDARGGVTSRESGRRGYRTAP